MAKASPIQNVFEGEFSPLADGRVDIDRYGRSMRQMLNTVPCRTGPAIGRSGTYFEGQCRLVSTGPSKLVPFVFNEEETLMIEFSHLKARFLYEFRGVAAHREIACTNVVSIAPLTLRFPGHDWEVGEFVAFRDFAANRNLNNRSFPIDSISGDDISFGSPIAVGGSTGALSGDETGAIVYEVDTPWAQEDLPNIRHAQYLNRMFLFCTKTDGSGDYVPRTLHRYDTFDWRIAAFGLRDGPYMAINTTPTYLTPITKGTWVPDMTSQSTPSGFATASSSVSGHEAWRAFDGDIDSYWECKTAQEGHLEYSFEVGFSNIVPLFSGATSGAMTMSASSASSGDEAWRAGDKNGNTDWRSSGTLPQWWLLDFGAAQTAREYRLKVSKNKEEFAPKDWVVEGATSSGGPWTTLDTRTGITWDSGERKHFTVQSPASFRYFRVYVTKVNRKTITQIIPKQGKKGKKGYVPRKTITTKTDNKAGFSGIQISTAAGVPRVVDGYTIYLGRYAKGNQAIDHAPRTFYFEGHDGDDWKILDSQQGYDNWTNFRSEYFPIQNDEAFLKYRIRIKQVQKHGDVAPRIGKLTMSSPDAPALSLVASSKVGINDGRGFLPTDVARHLRVRDADGMWRWMKISAVTDETQITCQLFSDDVLVLSKRVQFWRLGLWSDTSGWPTCGTIHEDRLFVSGQKDFPDTIVGSWTGNFQRFTPSNANDVVLDYHGINVRGNSRYMSKVLWLKSSEEALRIGTGIQEFILSAPVDEALSARNLKIRPTTKRGSRPHEPATVDTDVVFIQDKGRALYASQYEQGQSGVAAAYKAPLMSKLGAHLLSPKVVQLAYQQEPHSVIWGRREDGSMVAMTYSNDDDIFGGHKHNFGGIVHDIACLPSATDNQDQLWMVIERTIQGASRFYIERLYRFWDFDDIFREDATFVDSALRYYDETETSVVYGLRHLEGLYLDVLADKIVYRALGPVTNGALTLTRPALDIVVGLPYVRQGEIAAIEAGAEDGTAQGKSKRPHSAVLGLWKSARGEVGRWNEDLGVLEWTPIDYNFPQDELVPEVTLRTCKTATTVLPPGYGTLGSVAFRQLEPIPFNVVNVMPQLHTSDDR